MRPPLAAGVVVTQEVDQVDAGCRLLGLVIDQVPSAGTLVERDGSATLSIGVPPPPRPGCRR